MDPDVVQTAYTFAVYVHFLMVPGSQLFLRLLFNLLCCFIFQYFSTQLWASNILNKMV